MDLSDLLIELASPEDEARARANGFASHAEFERHVAERDRLKLEREAAAAIEQQCRKAEEFRKLGGATRAHGPASIDDILG